VSADLSKTGSGGNPHGFSMLVGTVLVAACAAPPALILVGAEHWLHRDALALPVMAAWTLLVAAVAHPLVILASRAIGQRRENLALVAQGK
jgi:divalent metal cation (Fe/Co/Zn/Cd) transporter